MIQIERWIDRNPVYLPSINWYLLLTKLNYDTDRKIETLIIYLVSMAYTPYIGYR